MCLAALAVIALLGRFFMSMSLSCGKGRLLSAGVCIAIFAATLATASDYGESNVKLTASAAKIDKDGRQIITIKMNIKQGWHAYANPVKNETFEPNRTEVKLTGAKKLEEVSIAYPPGQKLVDGPEVFQVYEGVVEITATVKRTAGDAGPLAVTVKYVTCNDKMCLPTETVTLAIK
jgi:DsbC/DsbD-like thiol-disulfide interchange protein